MREDIINQINLEIQLAVERVSKGKYTVDLNLMNRYKFIADTVNISYDFEGYFVFTAVADRTSFCILTNEDGYRILHNTKAGTVQVVDLEKYKEELSSKTLISLLKIYCKKLNLLEEYKSIRKYEEFLIMFMRLLLNIKDKGETITLDKEE